MKSASDQTTIESARDKVNFNRWATAHTLARRIPALPQPEKSAAISLLLSTWLDLLRRRTP